MLRGRKGVSFDSFSSAGPGSSVTFPAAGSLGDRDAAEDEQGGNRCRGRDALAQEQGGPGEGEQRLGELDLAGPGHPDRGHAPVPHHEAAELGDAGDVGQAGGGLGREVHRLSGQSQCRGHHGDRRPEVLRIAREAGAFVIEDDFARHLGHAGAAPLPPPLAAADADGVVVHIRSLTKVTAPSMRIAALTARGPAFDRLRNVQVIDSFFVPRPLQEAALDLIGSPLWPHPPAHGRRRSAGPPDRRCRRPSALAPRAPC
jgi:hypothetical protein